MDAPAHSRTEPRSAGLPPADSFSPIANEAGTFFAAAPSEASTFFAATPSGTFLAASSEAGTFFAVTAPLSATGAEDVLHELPP